MKICIKIYNFISFYKIWFYKINIIYKTKFTKLTCLTFQFRLLKFNNFYLHIVIVVDVKLKFFQGLIKLSLLWIVARFWGCITETNHIYFRWYDFIDSVRKYSYVVPKLKMDVLAVSMVTGKRPATSLRFFSDYYLKYKY